MSEPGDPNKKTRRPYRRGQSGDHRRRYEANERRDGGGTVAFRLKADNMRRLDRLAGHFDDRTAAILAGLDLAHAVFVEPQQLVETLVRCGMREDEARAAVRALQRCQKPLD